CPFTLRVVDQLVRVRSSECPEAPKLGLISSVQLGASNQVERWQHNGDETRSHHVSEQQARGWLPLHEGIEDYLRRDPQQGVGVIREGDQRCHDGTIAPERAAKSRTCAVDVDPRLEPLQRPLPQVHDRSPEIPGEAVELLELSTKFFPELGS